MFILYTDSQIRNITKDAVPHTFPDKFPHTFPHKFPHRFPATFQCHFPTTFQSHFQSHFINIFFHISNYISNGTDVMMPAISTTRAITHSGMSRCPSFALLLPRIPWLDEMSITHAQLFCSGCNKVTGINRFVTRHSNDGWYEKLLINRSES